MQRPRTQPRPGPVGCRSDLASHAPSLPATKAGASTSPVDKRISARCRLPLPSSKLPPTTICSISVGRRSRGKPVRPGSARTSRINGPPTRSPARPASSCTPGESKRQSASSVKLPFTGQRAARRMWLRSLALWDSRFEGRRRATHPASCRPFENVAHLSAMPENGGATPPIAHHHHVLPALGVPGHIVRSVYHAALLEAEGAGAVLLGTHAHRAFDTDAPRIRAMAVAGRRRGGNLARSRCIQGREGAKVTVTEEQGRKGGTAAWEGAFVPCRRVQQGRAELAVAGEVVSGGSE